MSKISLQNLKEERENLKRKLSVIELMIEAYADEEENLAISINPQNEYKSLESALSRIEYHSNFPKNGTWIEKITFLLDEQVRFLSNDELAHLLMPYFPNKNIDKLKRRVSVVISDAYKNRKIEGLTKVKMSKLAKDTVWGYDKWIDKNGVMIKRHRPFETTESGQMMWSY